MWAFRALHQFIAFLQRARRGLFLSSYFIQISCFYTFLSHKNMSPFLTCFPRLPTAEPCGQGHTRLSHVKCRPLIMPLVALVQKKTERTRNFALLSGARHSLSRRPAPRVRNFVIRERLEYRGFTRFYHSEKKDLYLLLLRQ